MLPIDFALISAKLSQNSHLILPAFLLALVLLKVLIFIAKLAFMPCGVNVSVAKEEGPLFDLLCVVEQASWEKDFRKKDYNLQLGSGASDGIGKEFALQLAKKGFNVLLIGRNLDKLEQVESEISSEKEKSFGVKCENFVLDYAKAEEEDFKLLREKCSKLSIAVLVNNAGVSHAMPTPFVEESPETLNQIIKVNCTSTIQVTRSILPGMIKNARGGLILNMGSVSAELKTPLLQTYAGSKAFLSVWSQSLAEEVKEHGIHVELLNTHFVTTNMSKIRRSTWSCPTPKSYVSCVLSRCGNAYFSILHPGHAIVIGAMSLIPDWILRSLTLKQMKATRKHALAKAAKLSKAK